MKLFDEVKLVTDKYKNLGASKGDIGIIIEIYDKKDIPRGYEIAFTDPTTGIDYARFAVHEEDVVVKE